ncbi:TPA: hypothetical protein ACH1VU_006238 [Pseudomonas aeruginosa]
MPIIRCLIITWLVLLSTGCMQRDPYRVERDLPPTSSGMLPQQPAFNPDTSKQCSENKRCVHFVEFDEFGNPESRQQFESGLAAAESVAKKDGVVVVYIHGWHHTARPDDEDITNFLKLVADTKTEDNRDVVGIYVGWRGDSINSDNLFSMPFSYGLTFWDRKNTAHRIGNGGGVTELVRTLSDIRSHNEESRLMVIGHSFGGAILYSAISHGVTEQIRRDGQNSSSYTPIADLVVLINPAFEAMRLRPLYSFARSFEYPADQKPRLMIITTKADFPTRRLFKAGRYVGTLFQGYPNDFSQEQDVTAIGHYEPYITHQLKMVNCEKDEPEFNLSKAGRPLSMCFKNGDQSLLLTRCDKATDCEEVTSGHSITRGPAGNFIPHRFPIYNIRTTKEVMSGHVDNWSSSMQSLLFSLLEQVQKPETLPMHERKLR